MVKRYHSAYPGSMYPHEPGTYSAKSEYVPASDFDALAARLAEAERLLDEAHASLHFWMPDETMVEDGLWPRWNADIDLRQHITQFLPPTNTVTVSESETSTTAKGG